jgi:hypothetical protein
VLVKDTSHLLHTPFTDCSLVEEPNPRISLGGQSYGSITEDYNMAMKMLGACSCCQA